MRTPNRNRDYRRTGFNGNFESAILEGFQIAISGEATLP